MWQWGTQSEVPLSAINCSGSLLWRKDCSLTFTADVGRTVKEGILLSSHLCWWSRVLVWSGPMQTVLCSSLLALQNCCLQPSWHPFSPPDIPSAWQKWPKWSRREGMVVLLVWLLLETGKNWWKWGKEVSDTWTGLESPQVPKIIYLSSVKWSRTLGCFDAYPNPFFLPVG